MGQEGTEAQMLTPFFWHRHQHFDKQRKSCYQDTEMCPYLQTEIAGIARSIVSTDQIFPSAAEVLQLHWLADVVNRTWEIGSDGGDIDAPIGSILCQELF